MMLVENGSIKENVLEDIPEYTRNQKIFFKKFWMGESDRLKSDRKQRKQREIRSGWAAGDESGVKENECE